MSKRQCFRANARNRLGLFTRGIKLSNCIKGCNYIKSSLFWTVFGAVLVFLRHQKKVSFDHKIE